MIVAALALQAAPASADEATNLGQDAGRTSFAGGGSLGAPPLEKRWTADLGSSVANPLIADGLVFVVSQDKCVGTSYCYSDEQALRLSALSITDGSVRWWRPVATGTRIAYDDGRVFLTAGRALTALTATSGELVWHQQLENTMTAPVAAGGLVYVNYYSGTLQAYEGDTGQLRWQRSTGLRSPPVVDAESVYLTRDSSCDPKAFDREDGTPRWSTTRDCTNSDDLAVDGGRVVVRGTPGLIIDASNGVAGANIQSTRPPALAGSTGVMLNAKRLQGTNLLTGLGLWDFTGDGALGGNPLVVNHTAYVGSTNGVLYGVDLSSGAQVWSDSLGTGTTPGAAGMAAAQGILAVPAGGKLVAYRHVGGGDPRTGLEVTGGPAGSTPDNSATFAFASEAGTTTHCRLDRSAWQPCSAGAAYTALDNGPHTFEVESRDFGTGRPLALATRSFSVDSVAPAFSITAAPSAATSNTSASFTLTPNLEGSLRCRLDDGAWGTCPGSDYYSNNHSWSSLAEGPHRVDFELTDGAGNSTQRSHSWRVDRTAPTARFTSGPPSPTYSNTVRLEFEANEPGALFRCQVSSNGASSTTRDCASPHSLTLPEGEHSVYLEVRDPAGNNRSSADSRTFVVDAKDPEVNITRGPEGIVRSPDVQLDFQADEPSKFECRVDSGAWTACGGGYSGYFLTSGAQLFTGLADGQHVLAVRARDRGGSVTATPASRSFTVKTGATRAELTLSQPADGRSATARFTSADPGSSYACSINYGDFAPCESPTTYDTLAAGPHTFQLRTTDSDDLVTVERRDFVIAPPAQQGGGGEQPPPVVVPPATSPSPSPAGSPAVTPSTAVQLPAPWRPTLTPAAPAAPAAGRPVVPYSSVRSVARSLSSFASAIGARGLARRKMIAQYRSSAAGRLTIRLTTRVDRRTVTVLSASARFVAGQARNVELRLSAKGRRALSRRGRHRMTTEVRLRPRTGAVQTGRSSFWLSR